MTMAHAALQTKVQLEIHPYWHQNIKIKTSMHEICCEPLYLEAVKLQHHHGSSGSRSTKNIIFPVSHLCKKPCFTQETSSQMTSGLDLLLQYEFHFMG